MKRWAIIRLAVCYSLCVSIILSAFYSIISINKENETSAFYIGFSDNLNVFSTEKNTEKEESATPENNENSSQNVSEIIQNSVEASTGDVKGNVIEKYISPYTAPMSYNGVYMKNSTGLSIDIKNLLNSKLSFKIEKMTSRRCLFIIPTQPKLFWKTMQKPMAQIIPHVQPITVKI